MDDATAAQATVRLTDVAQLWRGHADSVSLARTGVAGALVAAATDCLVAGVDSPALRELAGLPADAPRSAVRPVLDATLQELALEDEDPAAGTAADLVRLHDLVAVVLGDVRDLGLDLEVEVVPGSALGEDPRTVYLRMQDGVTMLRTVQAHSGAAEELARLADQVHEWIVEELPSHHRPTNWPPCPLHPDTHPLEVRLDQDDVVWACPRTGAPQARVGELAHRGRASGP